MIQTTNQPTTLAERPPLACEGSPYTLKTTSPD